MVQAKTALWALVLLRGASDAFVIPTVGVKTALWALVLLRGASDAFVIPTVGVTKFIAWRIDPSKAVLAQEEGELAESQPVIQWYPGHIAKAEKQLTDQLRGVDVVVELRDARIPASTAHPLVEKWVGATQPRIVVFARRDMVPMKAMDEWRRYLTSGNEYPMFWIDSKLGTGIREVRKAILDAGAYVNERRARRGIRPRPVRCAIIGFPNVGKSALINQLLGRKRAISADRPGVTRSLNWIRLGKLDDEDCEMELLDSPGIIPAKQVDQVAALRLAVCNDIGEAAYEPDRVIPALIELVRRVESVRPEYANLEYVSNKYGIESTVGQTGEDWLNLVADTHHHGRRAVAARRILTDFRSGLLGKFILDLPPTVALLPEPVVVRPAIDVDVDANEPAGAVKEAYSSKLDPATRDPRKASSRTKSSKGRRAQLDSEGEHSAAPVAERSVSSVSTDIPDANQFGASFFEGW